MSRLDTGSDSRSLEMRHEIKKLQSELREAGEEQRKLESQLASAKEEVTNYFCTKKNNKNLTTDE